MVRYLLRRLLFGIITLLLLSMLVFGMVKYAPTDSFLEKEKEGREAQSTYSQQIEAITAKATSLHFNLPVFYFTLTTADRPDTLDHIFPYSRRRHLLDLLDQSGNWAAVQHFEKALLQADAELWKDTSTQVKKLRPIFIDLRGVRSLAEINALAKEADQLGAQSAQADNLNALMQAADALQNELRPSAKWHPAVHWYGLNNQYHHWLTRFLSGDFGYSNNGQSVWAILRFPMLTTLFINGLAFFLAFLISIPLGIAMARRKGMFDRFSRWVLLFLYSMPGFWLGGLLLLLFASPNTGLYWIRGIDLQPYDALDGPFLLWAGQNADKFILPILTLTLHTLALIVLQLRGSIREVVHQDFIRTARAKGLSEKKVYKSHAFRNSLLPLITIFSGIFPAVFAGSIVVEYLFNFPGMGMKTYEAYNNEDFSVLFALLMIGSVMTVAGNFLGDILYAWADPRIRFEKQ